MALTSPTLGRDPGGRLPHKPNYFFPGGTEERWQTPRHEIECHQSFIYMRRHLFYKLDYGFKWNTQAISTNAMGSAHLHSTGKGQIPKSNWFWSLRRKAAELIHGSVWLAKVLRTQSAAQLCWPWKAKLLQIERQTASWVFKYGHAPHSPLVCVG